MAARARVNYLSLPPHQHNDRNDGNTSKPTSDKPTVSSTTTTTTNTNNSNPLLDYPMVTHHHHHHHPNEATMESCKNLFSIPSGLSVESSVSREYSLH
jgi:hypothetical protein